MHDKKGANKGKRGFGVGVSGCQMANTDCPRPALEVDCHLLHTGSSRKNVKSKRVCIDINFLAALVAL